MRTVVKTTNGNEKKYSTKDKTMTTKELAEVLGVDVDTITNTVKKLKFSEVLRKSTGGRPTMSFTEEQATLIKMEVQKHHNLQNRQIDTVNTKLEMMLNIQRDMQWLNSYCKELQEENQKLLDYKADIETKLENRDLVETPSENMRNHLWQNIQAVGKKHNGQYREAWHDFWKVVLRDLSIDVKTCAKNRNIKPMDYVCSLDIDTFNKVYAISEKMACGE